ncbi:hypothetical protein [Flavobacterium chungbukense]|uniref:YcxB-like protein domain-containing protein n=1 Tax=Flavobacterium chungbukense TaxID=877464 RepID=A0ABP7YT11_9FLAO|nr:hypothetical protein [Flavobacterium chungbukense]MCC4923906.1 hypothetical protein [Flavobacterium chungbukense]
MNVIERYNIEYTLNTFVLYPNKPSLQLLWWFLAGIIGGLLALFFLQDHLDEVMRWSICILLIYFVLHVLYDIKIGSKIHYIFDVSTNSIYKKSPLFSKKKIMQLDEAVIFTQSEMGSWYYALGAYKTQFIKNYRISEAFSSGRKSSERQEAYENFVLIKIDKLIEKIHLERNN